MIYFDKKMLNSAVSNTGPRVLATLANLLLIPIVLASFEVAEYGIYALYLSISTFAMVFTFPRIAYESKVGIARGEDEAFVACLLDRFSVSLPTLAAPLLLVFLDNTISFGVDVTLFLVVFYGTILPTILFQAISNYLLAKEEFFSSSALELFRAVGAGGISAAVAYGTKDLWLFAAVKGAVDFFSLGLLVSLVSFRRRLFEVYRFRGYHKSIRNYGLRMVVSDASATMRAQSTLWFIAAFVGPEGVTLFHVAFSSMFQRVNNHALSLINLVYSRVARGLQGGQRTDSWRIVVTMLLVGSALALLAVGLGVSYVTWLLPEAFSQVTSLFIILVISLPFNLASNLAVLKLVVDLDAPALTAMTLVAALVQLLLSFAFVSQGGLVGACFAVTVGSIAQLAISLLILRWRRTSCDG